MKTLLIGLVVLLSGCTGVYRTFEVLSAFGKSDAEPAKMEMKCKTDSLGVIRCREQ